VKKITDLVKKTVKKFCLA